MSESQSRYGIMETLNNRKIAQKDKLANIEKETDSKTWEYDRDIEQLQAEVTTKEKTYERDYKDRVRVREVNMSMLQSEFDRSQKKIVDHSVSDKDNYESNFQTWKSDKEQKILEMTANRDRYKELQDKKIADKKDILSELDAGIKSLKEMSAEQKET